MRSVTNAIMFSAPGPQRNNYIPHELNIMETRLRELCARSTMTRCPESIAIAPFQRSGAVCASRIRGLRTFKRKNSTKYGSNIGTQYSR